MPAMQVTIHHLNERFSPERIGQQDPQSFSEGLALHEIIVDQLEIGTKLEGDLAEGFRAFLATAPDGIVQAFSATVRSAIRREQPITVAWKPGYEWELSIIDVSDAGTRGGITMVFHTRYPGDPSPVDSSAKGH